MGRSAPTWRRTSGSTTSSTPAPGERCRTQSCCRVKADAPDFWRGAAFDRYDGRVWSQSPAAHRQWAHRGSRGRRCRQRRPRRPAIRRHASSGPSRGVRDRSRVRRAAHPRREPAQGCLRRQVRRLVSAANAAREGRPVRRDERPRAHHDGDPADERPAHLRDVRPISQRLYVQSGGATPRVAALAAQIAGDAPTTYDAIRALESWLGENTKYTLDIPPLPAGADTVEQFLFVDKRGFCMQIASSLTVMLRSLGVPARLVTGFAPGEESLLGGEFTVRGKRRPRMGRGLVPGCRMAGLRSHGERSPRGGVLELDLGAPVAGRAAVDPGAPRDRSRHRSRGWRRDARASPSPPASREAVGVALLRVGAEGRREARESTCPFRDSCRVRARPR